MTDDSFRQRTDAELRENILHGIAAIYHVPTRYLRDAPVNSESEARHDLNRFYDTLSGWLSESLSYDAHCIFDGRPVHPIAGLPMETALETMLRLCRPVFLGVDLASPTRKPKP